MRCNEDRIGALIWYEMIEHDISRIPSHIHIQTKIYEGVPLSSAKVMEGCNTLVGRVQKKIMQS